MLIQLYIVDNINYDTNDRFRHITVEQIVIRRISVVVEEKREESRNKTQEQVIHDTALIYYI